MFWDLVKHELQLRNAWRQCSKRSSLLPVVIVVLILLGLMVKPAMAGKLQPIYVWNVLYGFPFVLLSIGRGVIDREARQNTLGWWLSLPVSRQTLIWSKFLTVLWRAVLIMISMFLIGLLIFGYSYMLGDLKTFVDLQQFVSASGTVAIVFVIAAPLLLALGMLLGVLGCSVYRSLLPLIWTVISLIWALLMIRYPIEIFHSLQGKLAVQLGIGLSVCLIAWLFTYGLIIWMTKLLERKLN